MCRDIQTRLLGRWYNIHDPQDFARLEEAGSLEKCSQLAGRAARRAAQIMLEMKAEGLIK